MPYIENPKFRSGNHLLCPKCGMPSVDYDPYYHHFKCLDKTCGWVSEETSAGDYDFLTGSFCNKNKRDNHV